MKKEKNTNLGVLEVVIASNDLNACVIKWNESVKEEEDKKLID